MVNQTNWTGMTNANDLLVAVNTNTGGWFWASMVYMIFLTMLLSTLSFGFEASLLTSAFICFLIALMLSFLKSE